MYLNDWSAGSIWDSFRDMERMLDDINQTVGAVRRGTPFLGQTGPAVNVWANEDALVVTSEVPGVDPESINISVMGDTLTVRGKRRFGEDQEAEFNRSLQLPYRVDAERTEARCANGVLTIAMHRPETEKPRKITVKAA